MSQERKPITWATANRTRGGAGLMLVLLLCWSSHSWAAVRLGFHTREDGLLAHAFVVLRGSLDSTGEAVDYNVGFTPLAISPMVLVGPVKGEVTTNDAQYVRRSREHFYVTLTDEEYFKVLNRVQEWKRKSQPSFDLDHRNCVHFVADIAEVVGLQAALPVELTRKPRVYLAQVRERNQSLISTRNGPASIKP